MKLAGLEERLDALTRELAEAREALSASERRRRIDLELIDSEAIDLETARLLTEVAVTQMEAPDVRLAVADLKRRKPFLFRTRTRSVTHAPSMSVKASRGLEGPNGALRDAAEAAMEQGDRGSLLEYLRMRRAGR